MIQAVRLAVGGTIEAHFLGGRPTSVAVTVRNGAGTSKSTGAATLDTVSTTLNGAVAAGARTLVLTSATGVVGGRRYLVGSHNAAEAAEAVTVKSVSGGTATLWAPLLYAHATLAAFAGTRCTYAVSAGEADAVWTDGYADFVATGGDGSTVTEVVECWRRPLPMRLIDETDLRRIVADPAAALPAELDVAMAMLEARDEFLRRLGARNRAHAALGADHFRRPCALVFWIGQATNLGAAWKPQVDGWKEELREYLGDVMHQVPFDNKQTGDLTEAEQGGYRAVEGKRP